MGLEIVLEDERGERVESVVDPTNILHRILPESTDERFRCLSRVDLYGDTTFNTLQMQDLIPELDLIGEIATAPEAERLVGAIRAQAQKCQSGIHLYVKFYGD